MQKNNPHVLFQAKVPTAVSPSSVLITPVEPKSSTVQMQEIIKQKLHCVVTVKDFTSGVLELWSSGPLVSVSDFLKPMMQIQPLRVCIIKELTNLLKSKEQQVRDNACEVICNLFTQRDVNGIVSSKRYRNVAESELQDLMAAFNMQAVLQGSQNEVLVFFKPSSLTITCHAYVACCRQYQDAMSKIEFMFEYIAFNPRGVEVLSALWLLFQDCPKIFEGIVAVSCDRLMQHLVAGKAIDQDSAVKLLNLFRQFLSSFPTPEITKKLIVLLGEIRTTMRDIPDGIRLKKVVTQTDFPKILTLAQFYAQVHRCFDEADLANIQSYLLELNVAENEGFLNRQQFSSRSTVIKIPPMIEMQFVDIMLNAITQSEACNYNAIRPIIVAILTYCTLTKKTRDWVTQQLCALYRKDDEPSRDIYILFNYARQQMAQGSLGLSLRTEITDWLREALQAYQKDRGLRVDSDFELHCCELGYCLALDEPTREQNFVAFMEILTTTALWAIVYKAGHRALQLELAMCCRLPLSIDQHRQMFLILLSFILDPNKEYMGKHAMFDTINILFRQLPFDASKEIMKFLEDKLLSESNDMQGIVKSLICESLPGERKDDFPDFVGHILANLNPFLSCPKRTVLLTQLQLHAQQLDPTNPAWCNIQLLCAQIQQLNQQEIELHCAMQELPSEVTQQIIPLVACLSMGQ